MPELLLGVDIGTSSAKAVVLDSGGRVLGEGQAAYTLATPQPNWAEQEAEVWWSGLVEAVRKALKVSRIQEGEVAALGVSALYGGSGVPVDRAFRPLTPALIWMDRRAEEESAWVLKEIGLERLFAITGNGADPYYGFTKLLWIRRHWPEVWAKARYFLPPGSFLVHRLTGEVVVDHVTAGNLGGIYDLRKRAWSESLAEALGIPLERLPERLIAPTEPAGRLREEAARTLGPVP
jgi:xylulokinase